jgi:diguanylate cyclase (GGDEF)-like protein
MIRRFLPVVLVAALAVPIQIAGGGRWLDDHLSALRMQMVPRAPTGQIVIVDIDAKSLSAVGRWPWPRSIEATIVDRLRAFKAGEIAFDVDFSAASREKDDAAFEAALKRAGDAVILAAFSQKATTTGAGTVINRPIERFARHAWLADVTVAPDADGTVRRMAYGDVLDGQPIPSLAAMFGGGAGAIGRDFLIDFSIDADRIDRVSAIDLINGNVAAERIAGKKVIVGASAVELRDFFFVPVYGTVSGATLQVLAAESIAQGRTLAPTGPLVTYVMLALLLAAAAIILGGARWTVIVGALAATAVLLEAGAAVVQARFALAPTTGMAEIVLALLALATMAREIDFRRILLIISRNQTHNTQTILDRVIADNFAGVLVVDEAGTIVAASRTAEQLLGAHDGLVGVKAVDRLPGEMTAALRTAIEDLKAGRWKESGIHDLEHPLSGSERRIIDYAVTPSRMSGGLTIDGGKQGDSFIACLTFSDVTVRRLAEARLAYLARFDTLTGLANRNQFVERLEHLPAGPCAVVLVGLDRFHRVNETLGYAVGDMLLSAVAKRIVKQLKPGDLLARLDGDKFAVLAAGADAETRAGALARDLIARVGEAYDLGRHRLIAALSFGIVQAGDNRDAGELLKAADTALYRAKAAGGNDWVVFDANMAAGEGARQELEVELWEAFERGQFEVYYQPQIDLRSSAIIGVEALVYWRHPARGLVSPGEFIPVAETIGLIGALGEWVLERAAADVARWPTPVKVAVNVSAVQFMRGDLVGAVTRALRNSGLPAARLELEITESLFVQEHARVDETMREIRELGVGFALDDFGTGYSSLAYLHKFPIDKVKLDRSFIAGLPLDQEAVAIVRAVAALAQSLGIRLNAEGIEKQEQIAFLRLLGCDEGQGYLYSAPVPARNIIAKLTATSQRRPA